MEKELSLKQLIAANIPCETKYNYLHPNYLYRETKYNYVHPDCTVVAGRGRRIRIGINKPDGELLLNPIIIIEVDETSDLEFDISDVFDNIDLQIGGYTIDKLYCNQLKIYQAIKGYEIERVGSKIFFPLPFGALNKDEGIIISKCKLSSIGLYIDFTSNPCVDRIKDLYVSTDIITTKTTPDYVKISNYYIKDAENKDGYSSIKKYLNKEDIQIIKIKQNEFSGLEPLLTSISNQKIKLYFNHLIEKIFIYFENMENGSIYKLKPFDKISFIADGFIVIEYDYETLIYENDEKNIGYKLPRGVYQIDWNKFFEVNLSNVKDIFVELSGITVPNNEIGLCICTSSINYLKYESDMCRACFFN